jgi:hypothetical protein
VAGKRPSPPASAAPYPRAFPPVPRVVCRGTPHDAAAATDPRDLTFHRPDRAPAPRHAPLGAPASPLAALDPPELARLTSQVVDAIDRRLAAYRERHGRV